MATITFKHTGSFSKTTSFLKNASRFKVESILNKYGRDGVSALAAATPTLTGVTASSWSYKISSSGGNYKLEWFNSNINKGVPIAIILQYGHGTGTGGYVQGRDYINPAMQPIFDRMVDDLWREITNL